MITLTDAKSFLQITGSGTDSLIETYIDYVTAEIEAYIDNKVEVATISNEVLTLMGSSFDLQFVPDFDVAYPETLSRTAYYPIIPASAVTVTYDGTTLASGTDYILDTTTGLIQFYTAVTDYQNKLKISYTAGLCTAPSYTDTPADLKLVALQGVKDLYEDGGEAKQGGADVQQKKIGDFSVTYRDNKVSSTKDYLGANGTILNKYRRVEI